MGYKIGAELVKSTSSDVHALSFFVMTPNKTDLFTHDPIADLRQFVDAARAKGAGRLLILAGKKIVCRIGRELSPPLTNANLHFNQTEALAKALLTPAQEEELERAGSVEIDFALNQSHGGNGKSAKSSAPDAVRINVFFGEGSHNFIVFLEPDY